MNSKTLILAVAISFLFLGGLTLLGFLFLWEEDEFPIVDTEEAVFVEEVVLESEAEVEVEPELPDFKPTGTKHGTLTVVAVREGTSTAIRRVKYQVFTDLEGGSNKPVDGIGGSKKNDRRGGKFEIKLLPGSYVVQAQAAGFTRASKKFQIREEQSLDVTLELSKGLTISGRVFSNANGKAIEGATVRGYKELGAPDDDMMTRLLGLINIEEMAREAPAVAVSGPDGFYQLEGLEASYYEVVSLASEHSPQSIPNVMPSKTGVDFKLPEGSVFRGRVVDQSGQGVPNAQVEVYPEVDTTDIISVVAQKARPPVADSKTVTSGDFEVTALGVGLYNLHITAVGFQEGNFKKVRVHRGQNTAQDYVLLPGLSIAGRVVDEDGEPIAGARVRPVQTGNPRAQTMYIRFDDNSNETDEEGRFAFNSLSRGKYSVLAWHHDYAAKQLRDVNPGKTDLDIVLSFGSAVSGTVSRKDDGSPIEGAKVVVNDLLDVKKHAVTDADGFYRITGISTSRRGTRYVNIQAEGFSRLSNQDVKVQEGKEVDNQDFELLATATVKGRVVSSNGQPVGRARVMAKRTGKNASVPVTVGSAVSDETGAFNISNLEAGEETWISVLSSDYLEAESSTFDIEPGEAVEAGEIVLSLGGTVSGEIVDSKGSPISGAVVSIREEGETEFSLTKTTSSDSRGRFLLKGLTAGTIDLRFKSNRYLETVEENVAVKEGEVTSDLGVVLYAGSVLGGRVIDSTGEVVVNASVRVREVVSGLKEHRQETDILGNFSFSSLASQDTVEIEITHSDYSPHYAENVSIGQDEMEITLQRLGGVKGSVVDPEGNPIVAFSLQPQPVESEGSGLFEDSSAANPPARTVQDGQGRFEYTGLANGTYRVVVRAPEYASFAYPDVTVLAGEIVDLGVAELPEGGVVDGVILDGGSSRPIEGAKIRVVTGGSTSAVTSGSSGDFAIRDLKDIRSNKISLRVEHPDYVTETVSNIDLRDTQSCRNVQISLFQGGNLLGNVLDLDGKSKKGVSIYLSGLGELKSRPGINQSRRTDKNGVFTFSNLNPGEYRVTAMSPGSQNVTMEVDVVPGTEKELELVLEPKE